MKSQEIASIKKKLPHNSYTILSKMLNGKYRPRTIEAMFRDQELSSSRKMKPEVWEAVQQFLEIIKENDGLTV